MLFDPGACCDCGGGGGTTCVTIQWKYCIDSPTLLSRRMPAGYPVVVTRTSDGATLASLTTDANGQTSYCFPTGTGHTVTFEGGGVFGAQSFVGSSLASRTILVQPITPTYYCVGTGIDGVCPSGLFVTYRVVTITDVNGSWTVDLSLDGNTPDIYQPLDEMWVAGPGGVCVLGPGSVRYRYSVIRTNLGISVSRTWDVNGSRPASCGTDRLLGASAFLPNTATCPDIMAYGELATTDDYQDPVGGTVVVSS